MTQDRVLDLEGIHNFRDFGGYPVAGGGRLRRGVLWRSGQHHGATDADLSRIAGLGLVSVFDLRSPIERMHYPCRRPEGFAADVHVASEPSPDDAADGDAPHIAAAREWGGQRTTADTRAKMLRTYRSIAFRPGLMGMTRQFIGALAERRGPSLINCMAGKDRTGIAVSMVQLAAGVHRDDVIADYLLTNTAGDPEARIAAGAAFFRSVVPGVDDAVIRVAMGVDAEYLETALGCIAEAHGSVDAYLETMLGADAAMRARLRDALVES